MGEQMSREEEGETKRKTPGWIRRLGFIGKISAVVDLAVIAAWTVFFLCTVGDVLPPSWISILSVLVIFFTALLFISCAVIECILVLRENRYRIRVLFPVLISFLIFFVLLLLYNFFVDAEHMRYGNCFLSALLITIGSCLLNFWKRK